MRPEVVQVVHDLARENRARFRASYVATRAGVPLDDARRDLVALSQIGDLKIAFELLCPWDGTTLQAFAAREEIPREFSAFECGNGEPFEVTPELIWVTFTPTEDLRHQIADEAVEVEDPGKAQGPSTPPSARANPNSISSRGTSPCRAPRSRSTSSTLVRS